MDRNLDLKQEYEALQKHSVLLTAQNKDLQRELDSFVETDDIVRRNLDRKAKVDDIRFKVDEAIKTSSEVIYQRTTPTKSPNQTGFGQSLRQKSGDNRQQYYEERNTNKSRSNVSNNDFSPARKGTSQNYNRGGNGSPLRRDTS
jgi:hypothetical protein